MEKGSVRVAVEGCGHGTLHAIYASVKETCRIHGWNGVDLVIIGGDFQAVRNKYDLNVTAMPPKYRRMADFHEYYSGNRTAPYLTIFVGGNHEASNHLYELYYGGWVAPKIYYLGAANVIRFGQLRIAGLSGIYKHYDYRKSHFERLPYNEKDYHSIFHIRELDVRKMLSVRSQVDIGVSHDWPRGVEWLGDYGELFRKKDLFRADAESGRLGSVPARQCLDRLRPTHWFSAHLHIKYAAVLEHGGYVPVRHVHAQNIYPQHSTHQSDGPKDPARSVHAREPTSPSTQINGDRQRRAVPAVQDMPQVSAWQNFHADAIQADTEDRDKILRELQDRREEEEKTGVRARPQYIFKETFKKVTTDDDLGRAITSVEQEEIGHAGSKVIPNTDGCGFPRLNSLKRRRDASNPDEINIEDSDQTFVRSEQRPAIPSSTLEGTTNNSSITTKSLNNPDAIEIEMSDDEDTVGGRERAQDVASSSMIVCPVLVSDNIESLQQSGVPHSTLSSESEEGGAKLSTSADNFSAPSSLNSVVANEIPHKSMEDLGLRKTEEIGSASNAEPSPSSADAVSDDVRAELAALSSSFAPGPRTEVSPSLPLPDAISNKTTQFLSLDKCERNREFLQLLDIVPLTKPSETRDIRPLKLCYDPEWLAILRVFAPDLVLGGNPNDQAPQHRGDTYYRDRIIEEEKWIEEHVVKAGLLEVPENFTITAPVYEPGLQVAEHEMPREVTNPQTSQLCNLIGIDNPFDISEADRDARITRGPRLDASSGAGHGRGRGGFNGRGGGRGGRGGRGRGRGRH